MLLLPRTPLTFSIAFLGENMVQAICFTAAVAVCFEVIGANNPLAGTQFGLLTAATVLPIVYMGVLDGRAYSGQHLLPSLPHGVTGMYLFDGGLSLLACLLMIALMLWWRPTQRANTAVHPTEE
jgi:PAT family beta-lactamase induction signal transducer AmpG